MSNNKAFVQRSQAIIINPENAEAHNNIGNALKAKSDLEAAITSYQKALRIKPNYAEAYNNVGNALNAKGDLEAALRSYKKR